MDQIIMFIKPDGFKHKKKILKAIRQESLNIHFLGYIEFNFSSIRQFYHNLSDEIIKKCSTFFIGHQLPVYIISGNLLLEKIKPIKKYFRKQFGNNRTGALIHTTNSSDEFIREYELLSQLIKNEV